MCALRCSGKRGLHLNNAGNQISKKIFNPRLGVFLNIGLSAVFNIAAVIVVIAVNYSMRQQALAEAQAKARIILDRNLATHTYFSRIMKPSIFAWSEVKNFMVLNSASR